MQKKTHEEYVTELKIKNPTVEVVERYKNANESILHHCLIHDEYWKTTPSRALRGVGCKFCHIERDYASRCKTTEQYIEQVHKVNPNINVLGSYVNARTAILHRCNLHNIEWFAFPENILKGCGCIKCGNTKIGLKNSKSYEEYISQLKEVHPTIICIGEYVNSSTPILHKCIIDGYTWMTAPISLVSCRESGCPKCAGNLLKTHDEYVNEVTSLNPGIEVIGTYINARTKITHRCKKDGYEWDTYPYSILSGCGCPRCKISHGERKIASWLDKNNIKYISQKKFNDCVDKFALPFDFYLEDYNVAIEYDGEQHYRPVNIFGGKKAFEKRIQHDRTKTKYCRDNGIRLLRIPYYTKDIDEKLNNFLFI